MVEILNDPHIKAAVKLEGYKDKMVADLADRLMSTKTYADMSANERKTCVRHVVSQVESEQELGDRLRRDLGLDYFCINWHLSEPGDKTGEEARMLVKALGGLIAKNGALVMIMTADDSLYGARVGSAFSFVAMCVGG